MGNRPGHGRSTSASIAARSRISAMRSSRSTSEIAANARPSAHGPARRDGPHRGVRFAAVLASRGTPKRAAPTTASLWRGLEDAPRGRRSLDAPPCVKPSSGWLDSATEPAVTPNSADAYPAHRGRAAARCGREAEAGQRRQCGSARSRTAGSAPTARGEDTSTPLDGGRLTDIVVDRVCRETSRRRRSDGQV